MNMCGYDDVAPLDLWSRRYLRAKGYRVKVPDFETVGGISGKEYIQYEIWFTNIASEYGISPAKFHHALWTSFSSWSKTSSNK